MDVSSCRIVISSIDRSDCILSCNRLVDHLRSPTPRPHLRRDFIADVPPNTVVDPHPVGPDEVVGAALDREIVHRRPPARQVHGRDDRRLRPRPQHVPRGEGVGRRPTLALGQVRIRLPHQDPVSIRR